MELINDLSKLHPEVRQKIEVLLPLAKHNNLNIGVFETYRTPERSNFLYKKGTGAKAGSSYHNYGMACDIVFKDAAGNWTWDSKMNWKKLGELGRMAGLEWGGDGSAVDVRKGDMPHFQLSFGLKIKDLLAGKRPPIQEEIIDELLPYKKWMIDSKFCRDRDWEKPFSAQEMAKILNLLVKSLNK